MNGDPPRVAGILTPTVGREYELDQLQDALQSAKHGASVISIVAEAGLGKSRLVHAFINQLREQKDHVYVLQARVTADDSTNPYALIRNLFVSWFKISPNDTAAQERQKLEQGLLEYGAQNISHIPYLGYMLGFDYSANPALNGILHDSRQIRDRAFHFATQIFTTLLQAQPLLLVLEDLHWADDSSIDLLSHVIEQCRNLPLLIIATARPQLIIRRPDWGKDTTLHTHWELEPLSYSASLQLVDAILYRVPHLSAELRDLIASHAGGQPLYIEEIIKMMIDDGLVEVDGEEWQLNIDRLDQVRIPPTLTEVILARLNGLSSQEMQALQHAAVAGHVFWDSLLSALTADVEAGSAANANVIEDLLDSLQARELVARQTNSAFADAAEYNFTHAVLRDVIYQSILVDLRQSFHGQIANWLADRTEKRIGEFAGRIGSHYELAGDPIRSAEWYVMAGEHAKATYALDTAVIYFEKALTDWALSANLSPAEQAQQIRALGNLGDVLSWLGRFDAAIETFQQMQELACLTKDLEAEAHAWRAMAGTWMYKGSAEDALECTVLAETLARKAGSNHELSIILRLKGWAHFRTGDLDQAFALGEKAVALARLGEDQENKAIALNFLGGIHFMLGHYREAGAYLQEALQLFESLHSREKSIDVLNNLGVIAEALGDYQTAFEYYEEALTITREIGKRNKELQFLSNRGGARMKLGDYAAAEEDLKAVISMVGDDRIGLFSETYRVLTEALLLQGKSEAALEAAVLALEIGREFKALDNIAGAWRALGLVATHQVAPITIRDDEGSLREYSPSGCFNHSLELYSQLSMEGEQAATLRSWALYELQYGDPAVGYEMWNRARDIFTRLGANLEVDRMSEMPQRK